MCTTCLHCVMLDSWLPPLALLESTRADLWLQFERIVGSDGWLGQAASFSWLGAVLEVRVLQCFYSCHALAGVKGHQPRQQIQSILCCLHKSVLIMQAVQTLAQWHGHAPRYTVQVPLESIMPGCLMPGCLFAQVHMAATTEVTVSEQV